MASYLPSFPFMGRTTILKSLMQFTLKRFDILEAEALDLDNLEFDLGRNNVIELRDVGIKPQKLKHLLQLPTTYEIQKAKIISLRITIPVDLYVSPVVEIEGVEVKLRLSNKEETTKRKRRNSSTDEPALPTAADLAQSFIEHEPKELKELEDALAQTQADLAASHLTDSSDDESTVGMGQGLSLPAFVTNFILGIVDRIKVTIRGVKFELDLDVPFEVASPTTEKATVQLAFDTLSIEGLTTSVVEEESPLIESRAGKRHISLGNLRVCLISEASVFSSLARSPSMPSSLASRSPVLSRESTMSSRSSHLGSMAESVQFAPSHDPLQDSEIGLQIPYDLENNSDDDEVEDDAQPPFSSMSTPRASVFHDAHVPPELSDSREEVLQSPTLSTSRYQPDRPQPILDVAIEDDPADSLADSFHSSPASDSSDYKPAEDMVESRLYTHEEAESLYMSAYSQSSETRRENAMPGSWGSPEASPADSPEQARAQPPESVGRGQSPSRQPKLPEEVVPSAAYDGSQDETDVAPASEVAQSTENTGAETPRGQTEAPQSSGAARLVKEILSLKYVSLFIPSLSLNQPMSTARSLGKSTPHLPGAFSVHSSAPSSEASDAGESVDSPPDRAVEVILAPVEARFDGSVAFLLAMITSQLLDSMKQSASAPPSPTKPAPASSDTGAGSWIPQVDEIRVVLEKISVQFMDGFNGVAESADTLLSPGDANRSHDVLLQLVLEKLKLTTTSLTASGKTQVDIDRFRFGYADADILSFDRRAELRNSLRDAVSTSGADISVDLSHDLDRRQCEIHTRPLQVHVDLQRLDETFSWFGGLSGFLSMGSSITSNAPQVAKPPTRAASKPRGVRFQAPESMEDSVTAIGGKLNVRVGGLHLDLVGKDCSVKLESTSIKMVSRDDVIAVRVSEGRLSGPYLRGSRHAPVAVNLTNLRLEYLEMPKDNDLERLLELITPSKAPFDKENDVIMVSTLLKQRRKGPLLRVSLDTVDASLRNLSQLTYLPALGEEVAKLGAVAKYLPEDDRPGLLMLGSIDKLDATVEVGGRFGTIQASAKNFDSANISIPPLVAVAIKEISVHRNKVEQLVGSDAAGLAGAGIPVLMMRIIGNDLDPVTNVQLNGLNIEYRVPTIMDILDLSRDATPQEFETSLANSVAHLGDQAHTAIMGISPSTVPAAVDATDTDSNGRPMTLALAFRDTIIGLNPLGLTSKLNILLRDARLVAELPQDSRSRTVVQVDKAQLFLVDDVSNLAIDPTTPRQTKRASFGSDPRKRDAVRHLIDQGFVDICTIHPTHITAEILKDVDGQNHIDVEVRDSLYVMETCADSTQTLIALANALKPPTPPSTEVKFKTEVMPVEDLLASISGDAFGKAEGNYDLDDDFAPPESYLGDDDEDYAGHLDFPADDMSESMLIKEKLFDATSLMSGSGPRSPELGTDAGSERGSRAGSQSPLMSLATNSTYMDHISTKNVARVQVWDSAKGVYKQIEFRPQVLPVKATVRDVHVIWHLYDGYDWLHTRNVISRTVQEVETKAAERKMRARRRSGFEDEFADDGDVVADCLFNSIYITIPAQGDPNDLAAQINQQMGGGTIGETESVTATAVSQATTTRTGGTLTPKPKKLRLRRSRKHKISIELKGVTAKVNVFPPGSMETQSSVDVHVKDLTIFDNVPTSTWRKFATFDEDAAARRSAKDSMVHLNLLTVQPNPELAATDLVLKLTVNPLRLHVDQDALDFITRFFGFKDDSAPAPTKPITEPFIQRAEIREIEVTLDFKPKRVDYAGLRSGRTTEFMNFLIMENSKMKLRRCIIHGIAGFERLGDTLNDLWMPDIKRTQLPSVLGGLAVVQPVVSAARAARQLVDVPIREYERDGRMFRAVAKGATAFARSTGTELVKLGAKAATGTQQVLQGAEGLFVTSPDGARARASGDAGWDDDSLSEEEEQHKPSLYANQPQTVAQGLAHGYRGLVRDLATARDAIVAVPLEFREASSATGAAKAVLRHAPTVVFRPVIGVSKAIGQTLMGAKNTIDPEDLRRMEDKYKSGPSRR